MPLPWLADLQKRQNLIRGYLPRWLTDPATFSMGQDRILFQGDASENPVIRGGDVIYVPKTTKPDWNTILGIMSGVRTFQQIIEWFIPDK